MRTGPRVVASALVLGLAVAPAPGAADAPPAAPATEVVDRVAAIVGDEIVLLSEVDEEVYLAGLRGEISLRDPAAIETRRREVLDELVEAKILYAEARRQGIRVERSEIDRALDATLEDVRRRFPSEEAFEAQLAEEGVTVDQLRASQRAKIEEQLMVRQLVERTVRGRVSVDEREIRAYFDEHRAEIPRLPARLELRRIFVAIDVPGEVDSAAVRRAEIVQDRIEAGEDFATLARVFSEGPGAAEGGDVGWLQPADLEPAVARALFEVEPGENSGVIVSERGAQIVRVEETDPQRGLRLRQIVFLRDRAAARARAKARTESILARLRDGEDFAAVAEAESDDKTSAARGGHVGLVALESLEDEYRSVLETAEPGTIPEPVEDEDGFSIFRVEAREGERDATFEDVHDRIEEILQARQARDLYDAMLASAREQTYVEIRLGDAGG